MKREKAKKFNIRLAALLAAVVFACQIPSVSFARESIGETAAPVPTAAQSPEITIDPAPAASETPAVPTPTLTPTPIPSPTPVQVANSLSTPESMDMSLPVSAALTGLMMFVGNHVTVYTENEDHLPIDNKSYNLELRVEVLKEGVLVESGSRYYKYGHSEPVTLTILDPTLFASKITVIHKNGSELFNATDINMQGQLTILRIELSPRVTLSGKSTCTFTETNINLTNLVTRGGETNNTLKYYSLGTLIADPTVYNVTATTPITVKAHENGSNIVLAEAVFTVYAIDSQIIPSTQTILLGESANISVAPSPLTCGLHTAPTFTFGWTASSTDAGLPQANGQGVTVTPIKAGTYTYSVRITHNRGTDTIEKTLSAAVVVVEGTLTINHTVSGGVDPNQSFVFKIVHHAPDGSAKTFYEVIQGSGEKTIKGLMAGTYTVTPVDGWSWRYNCTSSSNKADLSASNSSGAVSFTSTRNILAWLSGEAFAINHNP